MKILKFGKDGFYRLVLQRNKFQYFLSADRKLQGVIDKHSDLDLIQLIFYFLLEYIFFYMIVILIQFFIPTLHIFGKNSIKINIFNSQTK